MPRSLLIIAILCGGAVPLAALPPGMRYADVLKSYVRGTGAEPGYRTPEAALGQPGTGHTDIAPQNNDPQSNLPTVVSLGQRGVLTLGFNTPVPNQDASARNPHGYDLLVWGNCFQGPAATTYEGDNGRFSEPGFIEVAQADAQGNPVEWFLILPRIYHDSVQGRTGPTPRDFTPAELLLWHIDPDPNSPDDFLFFSGDVSSSASLFDGLADTVPAQGAALESLLSASDAAGLVLDDPATYSIEGLGGAAVDLFRAVHQSSPGVPLLVGGQVQFAYPARIDLIRITDARNDDMNIVGTSPVTTEVDGIIVLPDLRDCHHPFADADDDGDVDMNDFAVFQQCYTGAAARSVSAACACFDRDADGDVDSSGPPGTSDLDAFRNCATRAGLKADPECEP